MNTRLQQFLSAENLSQSQFADKIGVARASISHIMAGRNKPGFDFILGMAKSFPALNLDWLITGKGKMYKQSEASLKVIPVEPTLDLELENESDTELVMTPPAKSPIQRQENRESRHPVQHDNTSRNDFHRNISRIVVFYDDNTYQELH